MQVAPAADRNKEPIRLTLEPYMKGLGKGSVLEVAR